LIDEVGNAANAVCIAIATWYGHPHMKFDGYQHPRFADWVMRDPDGNPMGHFDITGTAAATL
jgi:hypothetical protein